MSKLSLAERTKRALLAEHVENQIFANLDELERLSNSSVNDRGKSDDEGQTTRDEQQGQAKAIISQTRLLRRQYDELVSGKGSTILNAMEAAMMEGGDADADSVLGRDGIQGRYE
jgi:hypothetical protein